jgi:hypothetical protein
MSRQLHEPIFDDGIRNAHFFNGRLLTADDLKTEQDAARQQHRQLGLACGEGIVEGLEVVLESPGSPTSLPVVLVTKGLALNRKGHILSLPGDERVALVRRLDAIPPEAGLFGDCEAPAHTFSNLQNGIYVLVIAPASGYAEHIPVRGQRPTDTVSGCGNRYAVEGVQFRLVKLDVNSMSTVSSATRATINNLMTHSAAPELSKLRNMIAHLCFGTEELTGLAREPLKQTGNRSSHTVYGAVDFLRANGDITDCDVPLAIVFWRGGMVHFIDLWSVRRRVTPQATTDRWPPLLGERHTSEGEAMFLQFQDHIETRRRREPNPETIVAASQFPYLPPAGILPVRRGSRTGIDVHTFFSGIAHREPMFIEGTKLDALLREALAYAPIDLSKSEMVWLYKPWQNEAAATANAAVEPLVIFVSAHVPYQATPRFNVARWDYSNYAGCEKCVISGEPPVVQKR